MRYRYLRDPLFIACVILYFLNKHLLKQVWHDGFVHSHLNDLICIPFWVPIMLWTQARLGLRPVPSIPSGLEVLVPAVLWSIVFELWLPNTATFAKVCTADPVDALCYVAGAAGAMVFWNWWYREFEPPRKTVAP